MEKNRALTIVSWILIILGIVMIYLGGFYAPKVMLPPIVTGLGFFAIAWVFQVLKNK